MTREQWYWNVHRPQMVRNYAIAMGIGCGSVEDIQPEPTTDNPLCFTANESGADVSLIGWDDEASSQIPIWCHLQYSTDNKTSWKNYNGTIVYPDSTSESGYVIKLDKCTDKKAYFRADPDNPNLNGFVKEDGLKSHKFIINKKVSASGNIQYLLVSDGSKTDVPDWCYGYMFSSCSSLMSTPELCATTLADFCYAVMFYDCQQLTQVSELPATTLKMACYMNMFQDCVQLTYAPKLVATTLAESCYESMFANCNNLTACHMRSDMSATYDMETHGIIGVNVVYDLN